MKAFIVIVLCIWMVADLRQFFVAGALLECNARGEAAHDARRGWGGESVALTIFINTRAWPLKKEEFVGHAYSGLVDCNSDKV